MNNKGAREITLKSLREENNKSRAEVAAALKVTASALGHYEQGRRIIDVEQVLVLSELYRVSAEDIIYAQLNSCRKDCIAVKVHPSEHKRLYQVFRNMIQRCNNPNCPDYADYGGRGITICDEWNGKMGFTNFYHWALMSGYDKDAPYGKCTIDRIDNNKGYSPNNCRWTTFLIQNNNRRTGYA